MIPRYAAICWNLEAIKKIQGDSYEEPVVSVREEAFDVEKNYCFLRDSSAQDEILEEER